MPTELLVLLILHFVLFQQSQCFSLYICVVCKAQKGLPTCLCNLQVSCTLHRQKTGADDRADRFKQAVKYFYRGTLESFLQKDCKTLFRLFP